MSMLDKVRLEKDLRERDLTIAWPCRPYDATILADGIAVAAEALEPLNKDTIGIAVVPLLPGDMTANRQVNATSAQTKSRASL
jgi:hypothetical protein